MTKVNKEKQALVPQKVLHELFGYNGETGGWVWIKKPHPLANRIKAGQPAGSLNKDGYVRIGINGYDYLAHRLAWTYVYGDYPEGEQPFIDHINGKRADNRIANLRVSSHHENMRNTKIMSNNTSGVTGVNRRERVSPSGKIYAVWVAYWQNENGKQKTKSFNIQKLGEELAEQLVIEYRAEQLRLLEVNFGIVYSERHGAESNDQAN